MVRLLIILAVITLVLLYVLKRIRIKINNFFQAFVPEQKDNVIEKDEVIYSKDNIVVLKGESSDKQNK
jgi:hypothetical protein